MMIAVKKGKGKWLVTEGVDLMDQEVWEVVEYDAGQGDVTVIFEELEEFETLLRVTEKDYDLVSS